MMPGCILRIIVIKKAHQIETVQIRPDAVEAGIHIITALRGRIHCIVRYGGIDTCHNGIFFIAEGLGIGINIQRRSILKGIIDSLQQRTGNRQSSLYPQV